MTSVSASRAVASVAARERSWSSSRGRPLLYSSASSSSSSSSPSSKNISGSLPRAHVTHARLSSSTFPPTSSSSSLTSLPSSLHPRRKRLRSRSRRRPELVAPVTAGDGSSSSADSEAADARSFPLSDVTRAVLDFHSSEGNGNAGSRVRDDGTTARGGEKTVPLESWARRYGWEPSVAEQILWQSDCPLRGGIRGGGSGGPGGWSEDLEPFETGGGEKSVDPKVKTVDASVAYVGMWITFVEADFVVRALMESDAAHMTKKNALAAAQKAIASKYANCVPEGGTNIQRRTTAGAFGDVVKGLRRRHRQAADFPFALLTRKVKTKRVYRCVPAGREPCPEGWEIVLGQCGGGGGGGSGGGGEGRGMSAEGVGGVGGGATTTTVAVDDAREEKGGFGVRAGIGRGGATTPVASAAAAAAAAAAAEQARATTSGAEESGGVGVGEGGGEARALAAAAARRAARATTWKILPGSGSGSESESGDGSGGHQESDEEKADIEAAAAAAELASRQLIEAANRRRRARMNSW